MRVQFELTEILFIISSIMFVNSLSTIGWTFFSIAIISGLFRFGIRQAEKIEENKKREKLDSDLRSLLAAQQLTPAESQVYPKLVH